MQTLRCSLYSLFLMLTCSVASAQVDQVDFLLEYSTDSCTFDAKIIIASGQATTPQYRAQFSSTYTVVVPFGSTVTVTDNHAPWVGNLSGMHTSSDAPTDWAISNSVEGPPAAPDLSFYSVINAVAPASFHDFLSEGDTVKLFSFIVDPMPMCGEEVRPFNNWGNDFDPNDNGDPNNFPHDPTSDEMPLGLNYKNGFELGTGGQDYLTYRKIVPPPKPDVTYEFNCSGDFMVELTPTDSAMCLTPYTYEWDGPGGFFSTDESPVFPDPVDPGTYNLTITDDSGCDTIIMIDIPSIPSVAETETICGAGDVQLQDSQFNDGTWTLDPSNTTGVSLGSSSGGGATATFDATATGDYIFNYNFEGCEKTTTVSIMAASSTPNVNDDGPKCQGEVTTFTADAVAGATYEWFDGPTTGSPIDFDNVLEVSDGNTYTLVMTVAGCPSEVDVTAVYNPVPNTPILDVTMPVCEGEEVNFTATNPDGAADNAFMWTHNGVANFTFNTQNPTISAVSLDDVGTYTLIVEIDGCPSVAATIDLVVDPSPAIPSIDAIADLCEGDDLTLSTSATADSYLWTHTDSGSTYSGQNPTITGVSTSDAGEYTLTITTAGCDSDEATVDVVINPTPAIPAATATSPVCVGQPIEFESDFIAGATYHWVQLPAGAGNNEFFTEDHTINMAALSDAGTYELTVIVDGCESDPAMVTVVVNATSASPTASISGPVCEGQEVIFSTDEVPGATYTWTQTSPNSNAFTTTDADHAITSIDASYEGEWEVVVDLAGCLSEASTASLVINDVPAAPNPTSNSEICEGETLELYANVTADSYQWRNSDGILFSTIENPTIPGATAADDAGNYTLIVTIDGCVSNQGSTNVVINPIPDQPNTSSNSPVCELDTIFLFTDEVPGATYTWTGPTGIVFNDQNPEITGSSALPGDYDLYVSIGDCDSPVSTETIEILPLPGPPSLGANGPLCTGMDLELTSDISASGISGSATIEYCWSGPDGFESNLPNPTIASVGIDADGIYQLIIKADGCSSAPATINVDVYQSPEQPTIDPVDPVCEGGDVTLMANSSDSGVSFTWSGPQSGTGPTLTLTGMNVSLAGTYTVITSGSGCDSEPATIEVTLATPPTVDAGTYPAVCQDNGVITLAGNPTGGDWTSPDADVTSGSLDPDGLSGDIEITYTVTDANGCIGSDMTTITINELPSPDAGTYADVCEGADDITLVGTPAGGSFSGNGVSGNTFSPMTAGAGVHDITYTYTDGNSCTAEAMTTITVTALPVVDAGTYAAVCADNGIVALVGTPAGGTFSGDNVDNTSSSFDPEGLDGDYEIIYTYSDAMGCENTATTTITVNPVPTVEAGIYAAVCEDADDITLVGTPTGGTFSGDGVTGNTFNPSGNVGDVEITYEYADANGCGQIVTTSITVHALPTPDAGTYAAICQDAAVVTLVGTPVDGGVFTGDGVSGNSFDPALVSTGDIEITYTVTDVNGCSASSTTTISVNDVPTIDAGTYAAVCENGGEVTLIGSPTGGTFSGTQVDNGALTFDPTGLAAGDYEISYEYFDTNGCGGTEMTTITVYDAPVVDAGTYAAVCFEADAVTLNGTPTSGDWTGTGIVGGTFDPTGLAAGDYDLTYTFTDGNGCSDFSITTITIFPETTGDAGTYADVCIDGGDVALTGTPAGGTFSSDGSGVSGDTFSPTTAGEGVHTITYDFTDANGCEGQATTTITVNDLPTVSIEAVADQCDDASPVELVGTPDGGTFSGDGVSGDFFLAQDVAPGTYTITYDFTDSNGCENSTTTEVTVLDLPTVDAGTYTDICIDANAITLSGSTPVGQWSGPGVSEDEFDPGDAGIGVHEITHTYTDGNGCINFATTNITVIDSPVADAGSYDPICISEDPISLVGTPAGGTFSGDGVTSDGLFFDPFEAGVGAQTITYEVTINGCTDSHDIIILVNDLPNVEAGTWDDMCIYENGITLDGTPSGGTYTGPGVSGNVFTPADAGEGEHELTYDYTDGNGCWATNTTTITVHEAPVVDAGTYGDICASDGVLTLNGAPSGGTFSGDGVNSTDGTFDPSAVSAGTITISYIFEDANGCSDFDEATITVIEKPSTPIVTSNSAVCQGATIELSTDEVPGATYSWTGPSFTSSGNNPTITDADPALHNGTYSLVISIDGCDSDAGTVEVVVTPTPATPEPTYDGPVCEGGSFTVSVPEVPGAMYDWAGPSGLVSTEREVTINNATPGVHDASPYCVIITVDGCESEFACIDVEIKPTPSAPEITSTAPVCIGTDISFGTEVIAETYLWTFADGSTSDIQYPVIAGSELTDEGEVTLVVTIDGCESELATIDVVVNEQPTVSAGPFADMCIDEDPLVLVGSPENGTFTGQGVTDNVFSPADAGVGSWTLTYTFADANGCEAETTADITVNATPTLSIVSVDCSADLNTYTVTFDSDGDVDASPYTVVGNQVIDIPILENIELVATASGSSCSVMLQVSAPQCDCDEVPAAISSGDQETCFNEPNPALTVTADALVIVDWYDDPVDDSNKVAEGESFTPDDMAVGSYTYYAETRTEPDGCTSTTRTPVTLTIKEIPSITNTDLNAEICSGDMFAGATMMSDIAGTTFTWTASSSDVTGFTASGTGNLPAEVLETTASEGTLTYTITPTLNGCPGAPVDYVVAVTELPEITIDTKECADDLQTYSITYTTTGTVVADKGTPGTNEITGIPGGEVVTLTVTNSSGCSLVLEVTAPDCDCEEVPAPVNFGDQEICIDGAPKQLEVSVGSDITVKWYASPIDQTSIADGLTYTSPETSVGSYTYYVEATNTVTDCISSTRTEVTYTIHALPSITIESKSCNADNTQYTVTYSGTGVTVTSDFGDESANEIANITADQDIILTIVDDVTGCVSTLAVEAPECACDAVLAPVGTDLAICDGDVIPALSATVGADERVDWYDAASGGTLQGSGPTYLPTIVGVGSVTVYAEAVNTITDCKSDTRTPVTLTVNALPSITIDSKSCNADNTQYTVTFDGTGVTVTSDFGDESANEIANITADQDIILTIVDDITGCESTLTVEAPECACDAVPAPVGDDMMICDGDAIPAFSATLGADQRVDWYDVASGGTPLASGPTYLPALSGAGSVTVYAEAVNTITDCKSDIRTPMTLTANALPVVTNIATECTTSNTEYTVTFDGTGVTVTSDFGIESGNTITNIAEGQDIILTIADAVTGCENTINVAAPACACDPVPTPTGTDASICDGDDIPELSATVGADERVDWYDAAVGGTLLGSGPTYTPSIAGAGSVTIYAEAFNTITECTSDVRLALTLTVNALPTISFETPVCSADLLTYNVSYTTTSTVISASAGDISGSQIVNIPEGVDVDVIVEDATTTCSAEFTITAIECACDDITAPVIVSTSDICVGQTNPTLEVSTVAGTSVNWYADATTTTPLESNSMTYQPSDADAGTYTYFVQATEDATGCESDRIPVSFTINALPELTVEMRECAPDDLTYNVTISGDITLVSVSPSGTIAGNMIMDIAVNTDITVVFQDNVTGCENTQVITAPNCACDEVALPISGGDQPICFGETVPPLSVQLVSDITFNWYSSSTGLDLVGTGTTFTSGETNPGTYTYYVEAVAADGCVSNTRTAVSLIINALPSISVVSVDCSADFDTYTVTVNTTTNITATSGVASGNMVSGISIDDIVTITAIDPITGCETAIEVTPPTCDCDEVPVPTATDAEICVGDANPFLTASADAGYVIDWYDAAVDGNALLLGDDEYQPTCAIVGPCVVWIQARDEANGCTSDRVAVTLMINELPTLTTDTGCADDLSTYTITFATTNMILSHSAGDLIGGQIANVEVGTDVVIEFQDPTTGCVDMITVTSPLCDCTDVDNPIGQDAEICFGEVTPELSVTTASGTEVNWYSDVDGNQPVNTLSLSFTPPDTDPGVYTYYAQAVSTANGCESETVPVTLTINEVPVITNTDRIQEICSGESTLGFELTSSMASTTYSWTSSATVVSGQTTSGTGNIDAEVLTNASAQASSVIYTVTPTINGCPGAPVEFEVIVSPEANAGSDQAVECYKDGEALLAATGNGTWTASSSNVFTATIADVNDPNTMITSFEQNGTYEFIWTVDGCTDIVTITVGNECPCIIEANNVIDDIADTYCMTTGELIIQGEIGLPFGGDYLWEMSKDGSAFAPADGVNTDKDYDASNMTDGRYILRRLYTLATDGAECSEISNEIDFLVFSERQEPGEIMFDPNPVCSGDTLMLMVDDYDPSLTYDWKIMSGNARVVLMLDSMSSIVVESAGTISVAVTQSLEGCVEGLQSAPSVINLDVYPSPQPQLGIDTTFCELDATYTIDPGQFEEYLWEDGSDDQFREIEGEGIYNVTVKDSLGCVGFDEIDIQSFCCEFIFPNIFKADAPGKNGKFVVTDKYDCAITSKLYIYDRWGNLVHIGEDTNTWDGTFNGQPVAQGVYVYMYEYSAMGADREIFEDKISGDITVIREE